MSNFFYAPGVQDRSGELLGAGIVDFGRSMGAAVGDLAQTRKEAKAADALRDAMREIDPATGKPSATVWGLTDDEYKSKGWQDRSAISQAAVKSLAIKSYIQEQKQRQMENQGMTEMPAAIKDYETAQQPTANVSVRPLGAAPTGDVMDAGTGASMGQPTPGMAAFPAMLHAISKHPAVLSTPLGQNIMKTAVDAGLLRAYEKPGMFDRNDLTSPLPKGFARVPTGPNASVVVQTDKPTPGTLTDYQKAQLVAAAREKYLAAKRQVDSFSAMKDDQFAQSLLPGAQEALQSAQDELQSYGITTGAKTPPTAPQYKSAEDVRAAFAAGKLDRGQAKKILADQFQMN